LEKKELIGGGIKEGDRETARSEREGVKGLY
jgi:hypothetical protein